jgi:glycine cleavage system aminomethyltransferase T
MSYLPTELAVTGNKFIVEYLGEHYPCSIAEVGATSVFDPSNERIMA